MKKPAKIIAISLAFVIGLLAIGAAILAATFDPNKYKPLLIRYVAEQKQRTLAIPGEIKLSFFPRIGAKLGAVSLSERSGKQEFASVQNATASLALLPLFTGKLIVDRVSVEGLKANIVRYKDGRTNFDDLLSKNEEQSQEFQFDIAGVDVRDAQIRFDDQKEKRLVNLQDLDLNTGKIANGARSKLHLQTRLSSSQPKVDAKIKIDTGFSFDLDQKHYSLQNADAAIEGQLVDFTDALLKFSGDADLKLAEKRINLEDVKLAVKGKRKGQALELELAAPQFAVTDTKVSGGKLQGEAKVSEGQRTISANFAMPTFEGTPQAFKLPNVDIDSKIKDSKLDARARLTGSIAGNIDKLLFESPQLKLSLSGKQNDIAIDGSITTPLTANLQTKLIELPNIVAAIALPNPAGGAMKLNANGRIQVNLAKSALNSNFKIKLDESHIDAKFGLTSFSPMAYDFDVDIDKIDADHYLGKSTKEKNPSQQAAKESPIDLAALRDLRAKGKVRIGAFKLNNIKASNVHADLAANSGKVTIEPLSANLYGGSTNGAVSATASDTPRFTMHHSLSNIQVGPLLKDLMDKIPVEGRGNVALDIAATGNTFTQLKKNLNGTGRLELRDGAVHGINVAQVVRQAKSKINTLRGDETPQTGTSSSDEKTDFSDMSASFKIANGIAHNDDLLAKTPLLRVGGAGDINIGEERLDYLVKATVVPTLQGQGGPELQALKGLTVPVRLSGPFTAIGWKVDLAGLVRDSAKQKIDERKEEIKNKVQDQLKEQLKGLFGK